MSISDILQQVEQIDYEGELAYEQAFLKFREIGRIPQIKFTLPKETKIFRSRTHIDEDLFHKKSDLSCPPRAVVKAYGRFNRPYQSTFYGSDVRPTSYLEFLQHWAEITPIGEELSVTLGVWQTQKDLELIVVPKPYPKSRATIKEKFYGNVFDELLAKSNISISEKQTAFSLLDFISGYYSKPAKHDLRTYIITSAYSNLMLTDLQIAGALYPSAGSGGEGYNVAIRKSLISGGALKLIEATKQTFATSENLEGMHSFQEIRSRTAISIQESGEYIIWNS